MASPFNFNQLSFFMPLFHLAGHREFCTLFPARRRTGFGLTSTLSSTQRCTHSHRTPSRLGHPDTPPIEKSTWKRQEAARRSGLMFPLAGLSYSYLNPHTVSLNIASCFREIRWHSHKCCIVRSYTDSQLLESEHDHCLSVFICLVLMHNNNEWNKAARCVK